MAVNRTPEQVDDQGRTACRSLWAKVGEILSGLDTETGESTPETFASRSLDGGHHFDEPRTVNDDGLEIGHRFPVLSVRPQGAVRLNWIDKRALESARAGNQEFLGASLYTAVSRDRGEHFEANQKLIDHSVSAVVWRSRIRRTVILSCFIGMCSRKCSGPCADVYR